MIRAKRAALVTVGAAIALSLCACGTQAAAVSGADNAAIQQTAAAQDIPADPAINSDNARYWAEVLQSYREDDAVHQVLFVRYTGGCSAIAQYFVKSETKDAWELRFQSEAIVGKYGIGKTSEGDAKTPVGDIGVRRAFGILKNPGTTLEYVDVEKTTYACDEDCEYYNQIIDTQETGHACTGEDMYSYSPQYNYGLETTYNDGNVYPNGSAIFIHCKGVKGFSGGCIALDQADMKAILETCDAGMRIIVHEN